MNERVMRDVISPIRELRFCRQLSIQQQVSSFDVGASLREFFDRISAVAQNALVPINESDFALTGSPLSERRAVTHQTKIAGLHLYRAQIDPSNRVVLNRNFDLLPASIVGYGK